MEGSEWGRLPPEMWNKVIVYLILNDGFYANPELLGILDQIADPIHGGFRDCVRILLNRGHTHEQIPRISYEVGYSARDTRLFDNRWCVTSYLHAPMGRAHVFEHNANNPGFEFCLIYTADNNILIREHIDYHMRGTEEICWQMNSIYETIRFLPFGCRIRLESKCDPCYLTLMYPVEVAGKISFMMRRIRKRFVQESDNITKCFTRIDLGFYFPFRGLRSPQWSESKFDRQYLTHPDWTAFAIHCGFGKGYRYHRQVMSGDLYGFQ